METIFLVLSGVILAAGVLYWFWSHIQLTQKKVQLLENAVFELRGLVSRDSAENADSSGGGNKAPAPGPAPVYQDLADDEDEWAPTSSSAGATPAARSSSVEIGSTPLSSLQSEVADLQPGGRLEVPAQSPSADERVITTDEKFRELFVQREPRVPSPSSAPVAAAPVVAAPAAPSQSLPAETTEKPLTSESLESMPVKDLRRLAEQRGITGVSDMRKKEILSALRQQVVQPAAVSTTVVVEHTLDLTEVETVAPAPASAASEDSLQEATVLE